MKECCVLISDTQIAKYKMLFNSSLRTKLSLYEVQRKKVSHLKKKNNPKLSSCCESRQHSVILGAGFFSFQGTYLLLKACNLRFTICYLGYILLLWFVKDSVSRGFGQVSQERTLFSHPNSTHHLVEGFKQLLEN